MEQNPNTIKSHCNECLQQTNHDVLAHQKREWPELDDTGNCVNYEAMTYFFVQCRGCESVSLRRVWEASYAEENSVDYFPPAVSRARPTWMSGIRWWGFDGARKEIRELLGEVYSSVYSGNMRLAMMGARGVLDVALTDKLGDIGGFNKKLEEATAKQWITPAHLAVLSAAIDAGHAATHRAYKPDQSQMLLVLDVVEHLVQLLYVLDSSAGEIARKTPSRQRPKA